MSPPLFRYRGYILIFCGSLFFLVEKYGGLERAEQLGPLVLFAGALAFIGTRLRIKGLRGSLATSNAVLAGGVIVLPPPLVVSAMP